MSGLPKNWEVGEGRLRWTPNGSAKPAPVEQAKAPAIKQVQPYGDDCDPGDMSSHLLTLPSLTKWRKYWTENEQLSCGGWFLRHVAGFVNDD